jgi:hypothetical protein
MRKRVLFISLFTLLFLAGGYWCYTFFQRDLYEGRFPVTFNDAEVPQMEVKIEGKSYWLKIDLGAFYPVSLTRNILEQIQEKTYHDQIGIMDVRGNTYFTNSYIVPEIRVRNLRLWDCEVREESLEFLTQGAVIYSAEESTETVENIGTLGRPVFQDINLLLDFHHSMLFACRHLRDRKREGYRFDGCAFLLLEKDLKNALIVKMITDKGVLRMLVDTGCTKSLIKSSIVSGEVCQPWLGDLQTWHTSKCILGGREFDSMDFVVFPINEELGEFDGILGMDFIRKHVLYFDFKKKTALIGKVEECFPAHLKYPYPEKLCNRSGGI